MRVKRIECLSCATDPNAARSFYEIVARVFASVPPLDVWWVPNAIDTWADSTGTASRRNYQFDAWGLMATVTTATSERIVEARWRRGSHIIETSVVDFGEHGSIGAAMEVLVRVQPYPDRFGLAGTTVTMIDGRKVTHVQAIRELFEVEEALECGVSSRTFTLARKIAGR